MQDQSPIPTEPANGYPKRVLELYTKSASQWLAHRPGIKLLRSQRCDYLERRCLKMRKSNPEVTLGTCTVGFKGDAVIICPYRFLQGMQIFRDALPLLDKHEQGNQVHVVSEVEIPGGNVDFFVVSTKDGEIRDYLALEVQTLDTTGTVWPARQDFIIANVEASAEARVGSYGMNWKMTAKTTLLQIHHKAKTLDHLGKKIVLVVQDCLYRYISAEFNISEVQAANRSDNVHFHIYGLNQQAEGSFSLSLADSYSTTPHGIELMLGTSRKVEISDDELKTKIGAKISGRTLLSDAFHPLDVPTQVEQSGS